MPSLRIDPTPNPNSIKITTDGGPFIDGGMVSVATAEEAEQHPLGRQLFAIEGITNVLILPQFVTVSKTNDADWNAVLPDVERILNDHLDGNG